MHDLVVREGHLLFGARRLASDLADVVGVKGMLLGEEVGSDRLVIVWILPGWIARLVFLALLLDHDLDYLLEPGVEDRAHLQQVVRRPAVPRPSAIVDPPFRLHPAQQYVEHDQGGQQRDAPKNE